MPRSLGDGGLVFHVDDLNAPIHFGQRIGGVLQLGLAVSDGDKVGAGDAEFVDQVSLDRVGATLREFLVVGVATRGVGMTGDNESRTLQVRI